MTGPTATLLVVGIALVSLLSGRLLAAAFGGRLWRWCDPPGFAASLAVGTATLVLLSVVLSGLGFPTRDLPPLVAALHLVPLGLAWRRRRLDALRPRGGAREWASLLVPAALTIVLALLPVTRGGGFSFGNDTYTYSAFAEWLQLHGYSEECRWEAHSPVTGIPALYQSQGYDLGIAHWLALVQAATRPASVLLVYPSTSAFGLVLLTASLWLAARQLLRLPVRGAFVLALVFAAVPHALYWGHHNGSLQQSYALPMVVLGLVLLARTGRPGAWNATSAALLAVPFAFLFSVYLPLLPLLGFAAAVALLPPAVRANRRGQLLRLAAFGALTLGFVVLYAARDFATAVSPLHRFATSQAGGHIPWGPADFFRFALGTRVLAPGWVNAELPGVSALNRALTPLYGALVLLGLGLAAQRARTRPLAASATLLLAAAAWFALAVEDPWSGRLGHTWNLFKLSQWGWPLALLLGALASRRLLRLFPARHGRPAEPGVRAWRPRVASLARAGIATVAIALPASQLPVHWPWSLRFAEAMREILPGATLADLPELKRRIQALPRGTLLVVGRPANVHRWLASAVLLLSWPRAVVADWSDSASVSNHPTGGDALFARLIGRWNEPHVVPIVAGLQPFDTRGVEPLGFGFARIPQQLEGPLLLHVVNPSGVEHGPPGGPRFELGRGRTKLVVFAPEGGAARLDLQLLPYRGRPGPRLVAFLAGGDYSHRSVRLASEGAPVASLPLGGETSLSVPLELPRGLATVVLVLDEGRGTLDARDPVTVVGLSLVPTGGP